MGSDLFNLEPIENLASIHDSDRKPVTKSDRKSGIYPYYGASGITDYVDGYLFDGDYVLLAEDGDNLRTRNTPIAFMAKGKFWVNNHAHILKGKNGNQTDFICYALQVADITSYISGSTRPKITQRDMKKIPISSPPISEQKAIAHILGSLDDKIELNRQMNQTLESMAQALFKSWFVDFDPVIDNALAAGNEIPEVFAKRAEARAELCKSGGVSSDFVELFPSKFEYTEEMGWIPKGWGYSALSQNIEVLNGFAFKSKDYSDEGVFVLRTKNFNSKSVVEFLSDDVYLPNEFKVSHSKYLCEPFDYHLIMVGASVGNRGLVQKHHLPALRNQNMWCFRPKEASYVGRSFVKNMLDSIISSKIGLASGSAREFFRKGDFQNHVIVFGNEITLGAFEKQGFSILEKQAKNEQQILQLTKLRDTLLPKLLSGELRIPDAEKLISDAEV